MEIVDNLPENDVWPECVDAAQMDLVPPKNWNAACARSQMRHGADIGEWGRDIVSDINAKAVNFSVERDEKFVCIDRSVETSGGFKMALERMFDFSRIS
ncbi:hypothetical protein [Swingsia samuiensis]|uniref:Uncharacterized protein n=1 Tax=Swingsia samuiensis TaxID=1293412 RepID=A0A4Y6UM57_9PROT|nr:hypothetical protein [Swingsia samuiensis]QDH17427.1 hypothetical protein E3D00_07510 [Swingsia samuiensis]